jgi:hypothetical protein
LRDNFPNKKDAPRPSQSVLCEEEHTSVQIVLHVLDHVHAHLPEKFVLSVLHILPQSGYMCGSVDALRVFCYW